jgi:2-polyprenyl-6-methoxyphenol hydroxylase-like FAD-dependent oxidoreductase
MAARGLIMDTHRTDVCVQGSGIVGACLALSLARLGLRVDWVAPPASTADARPDVRAYALNGTSIRLLVELKVWQAMPPTATTPVRDMRIVGDAGGRLDFSAWQQGVDELAWIVDAAVLERRLRDAIGFAAHVRTVPAPTPALLVAHCEGKHSAARERLGVRFERHAYGHSAIAARLVGDRPHEGVAHQWFRSPDVLALLPFDAPEPGRSWALVWSAPADSTREWAAESVDAFERRLADAVAQGAASGSGSEPGRGAPGPSGVASPVGRLRLVGERAVWPLMLARADRWSGAGWVLLGDAAHVVHPLAGQGLNLGLADVVALTRVLAAREPWRSPGDAKLLRRYERARQGPTLAMGGLTDGLLHLFAAPAAPFRPLRNAGLALVDRAGPVKRWLAAHALDS